MQHRFGLGMYVPLCILLLLQCTTAFTVAPFSVRQETTSRRSALMIAPHLADVPPITVQTTATTAPLSVLLLEQSNISPMTMIAPGRPAVLDDTTSSSTTGLTSAPTVTVAIQEYKTPTAEELADKKRNFNVIFWGGGFVAPFLATVFYFGARFWER